MADVRQRKKPDGKPVPKEILKKEDGSGLPILEILRALVFLLIASSALSYFVTRESFVWGIKRPQWSRLDVVKAYIVCLLPSPQSSIVLIHIAITVRTKAIHRRRPRRLRRNKPRPPHPPRHQRHGLRCFERQEVLRPRRQLLFLCGRGCE
jgi:hypothetical protein